MNHENREMPQEKMPAGGGKPPRKEVDLFPAVADKTKSLPVVPVSGATMGVQINTFSPVTFDEALEVVQCLRERCATTISLEKMRKQDANRLVDFVTGASAALDGAFHKLNDLVYVFCPSNIRLLPPGGEKEQVAAKTTSGPLDFLYPELGFLEKSINASRPKPLNH